MVIILRMSGYYIGSIHGKESLVSELWDLFFRFLIFIIHHFIFAGLMCLLDHLRLIIYLEIIMIIIIYRIYIL